MPKCIGWDIGIKNLAYCVLDSPEPDSSISSDTFCFNNNNYTIVNWKDISLVSQIEINMEEGGEVSHINNTMKCSVINEIKKKTLSKKGSKKKDTKQDNTNDIVSISENSNISTSLCGKPAIYCKEELITDSSGNTSYFGICKTHYKKLEKVDTTLRFPELSVKKCWSPECNSKPNQVLKKHIYKGYCKKHINDMIKETLYIKTDFLNINRAKTTSKFDINQLGIALFQELDKIKDKILESSIILLENQPVLKNPTMKSIQMFLYSYYLLRIMETNDSSVSGTSSGISSSISSSISNNLNNKKIQCYCASKKLDLITFLPETEQLKINELIEKVNSGYQKNKKMAIMMVESLLQNNQKWLAFFKGHPKQDDLADSLLMTLHYFEKGNLLKIKSDDKKKELKKIKEEGKKEKEEKRRKDE
jgi:hypothetical protein